MTFSRADRGWRLVLYAFVAAGGSLHADLLEGRPLSATSLLGAAIAGAVAIRAYLDTSSNREDRA